MSLLKGTSNVVKFKTEGDAVGFVHDRIDSFAFNDIDETTDSYSVGWVDITNMLCPPHASDGLLDKQHLFFAMRIDERKVQSAVLQKYIAKEEAIIMREKQIPRLSKGMKREIKERITAKLEREEKPKPTVTDVYWDRATEEVFFFSTTTLLIAVFEDFFKETFGLTLIRQIPYLEAKGIVEITDTFGVENLNDLAPSIFA